MTDKNRKLTVVVDIDNTVIDSVHRKQLLLRDFDVSITEKEVRSDFHLTSVLGFESEMAEKFFRDLNRPETIEALECPTFPKAPETLNFLRSSGYEIVFFTGRPEATRNVTIQELESKDVRCDRLLMPDFKVDHTTIQEREEFVAQFKRQVLNSIATSERLLTVIGDRPIDIRAAQELYRPAILFLSTVSNEELNVLMTNSITDIELFSHWEHVPSIVDHIESGRHQMKELRLLYIHQYSMWMRDIDYKIYTIVTISGVVSAIIGALATRVDLFPWGLSLMLPLGLSSSALIFAIRGLSSRHTSGKKAAQPIRPRLLQWIAIPLGKPTRWLTIQDDAIERFNTLRYSSKPHEKAIAHVRFFNESYKTYDPDALLNLRLYEMRAANYAKVYPERKASQLLVLSIAMLFLWVLVWVGSMAKTHFQSPDATDPSPTPAASVIGSSPETHGSQ